MVVHAVRPVRLTNKVENPYLANFQSLKHVKQSHY